MSVLVRTSILYHYISSRLLSFCVFSCLSIYFLSTRTHPCTQVFTLTKEFGSNATDRISVERNWKVKKKKKRCSVVIITQPEWGIIRSALGSLSVSLFYLTDRQTHWQVHMHTHTLCVFSCVCACVIYTYTSHEYSYCRILKNFYLLLGAAKELNSKC